MRFGLVAEKIQACWMVVVRDSMIVRLMADSTACSTKDDSVCNIQADQLKELLMINEYGILSYRGDERENDNRLTDGKDHSGPITL